MKLSYALDGICLMVRYIHIVYTYFLIDNSLSSSIPSVHLCFMYLPTGVSFENAAGLHFGILLLSNGACYLNSSIAFECYDALVLQVLYVSETVLHVFSLGEDDARQKLPSPLFFGYFCH